ncbi:MAG: hypothetical protein JO122_13865, partial [Acetobacteraceae bacterium]|nr:hypothetical protein [Acetobacteraceae bacterium]
MITRKALGAIALATTCLSPLAAFAQAAAPAAPPAVNLGSFAAADASPAAARPAVLAAAPDPSAAAAPAAPSAVYLGYPGSNLTPGPAGTAAVPAAAAGAVMAQAAPPAAPASAPAVNLGSLESSLPLTGEIGIGAGGVAGHNPYQGGRYNGLNTGGADFIGQFDLGFRDPWDSGGTKYFEGYGDNLVFQTGNNFSADIRQRSSFGNDTANAIANAGALGLHFGEQGTWETGIDFRSITYTGNIIDSPYTVSGTQGILNPGLTPFGGATSAAKGPITSYTVPTLNATGADLPFLVGTRRD